MMGKYIRDRKGYIGLFLLCMISFGVLSFLYGMPVDGVLYGTLLCLVFFLTAGIIDGSHYRKKHQVLVEMVTNTTRSLELLMPPTSLQEADYQVILGQLQEELGQIVTSQRVAYTELKDFYALWVHQIKTPIAAMSLLIQEEEGFQGKQQLAQELFKVERYVEVVLNYLRLEDASSDLSLARYDLEDMVRQAVKKYAPIFIGKKISLKLEGIEAEVLTDDKWLVFVIEQLLSNALKYTGDNGLIRIYRENEATLVIEDNGMGIVQEDLPRVFERGFTGFNGRMDKKATGLGLYLTKKTLDKLGHTITIQSREGIGTIVKVDLSRKEIRLE